MEVERQQEALGLDVEAAQPVEELLVAEIDVLRHASSTGTRLVSWNTMAMPRRERLGGRRGCSGLPSNSISPGGQLVDAGEHFGQRRFAGAVLADDGVDLASLRA